MWRLDIGQKQLGDAIASTGNTHRSSPSHISLVIFRMPVNRGSTHAPPAARQAVSSSSDAKLLQDQAFSLKLQVSKLQLALASR